MSFLDVPKALDVRRDDILNIGPGHYVIVLAVSVDGVKIFCRDLTWLEKIWMHCKNVFKKLRLK